MYLENPMTNESKANIAKVKDVKKEQISNAMKKSCETAFVLNILMDNSYRKNVISFIKWLMTYSHQTRNTPHSDKMKQDLGFEHKKK